ncbi:MAG: lactonase family protein [Terriglobia bacterium]
MPSKDLPRPRDPLARISRRGFLKGTAALAAAPSSFALTQGRANSSSGPILAYVCGYSGGHSPERTKANEHGIFLFHMDLATGALSRQKAFADDSDPGWLAFDSSGTHLYAANETETFQGAKSGSVSAFSVDRSNGNLTLLNTVSSQGAGPCYLSVHPSGKYLLVANFSGGSTAVFPIRSNGDLGPATDVKQDRGTVGPIYPTSAPRGNFAIFGHDGGPHTHMMQADPSGRFVLVTDLALDKIFIWKFDVQNGTLTANDPPSVALPPGDGPRHFVFANAQRMYSLQEQGSTLVLFDFDSTSGSLTAKQTVSTLPKGFTGTSFASGVNLSPNGRFVYAANRLHDSIAIFSIGKGGKLSWVDAVWTRGDFPRAINIDPTGNFLCSCNQRSDAITTFRINRETGALTFTGHYAFVGAPAAIVFLS